MPPIYKARTRSFEVLEGGGGGGKNVRPQGLRKDSQERSACGRLGLKAKRHGKFVKSSIQWLTFHLKSHLFQCMVECLTSSGPVVIRANVTLRARQLLIGTGITAAPSGTGVGWAAPPGDGGLPVGVAE